MALYIMLLRPNAKGYIKVYMSMSIISKGVPNTMTHNQDQLTISKDTQKNDFNRSRYIKNLIDRYESDVPDGFQNEVIQNSIDAYDQRNIEEALQIEITIDPENNTLQVKDNAGGMTKKTLERFLTFEEGEKFGEDSETRGSRGQGGAVLLGLGELVEIETVHNGNRTSAKWTVEDHAYGFKELQQLRTNGTIFRVKGVKDRYIEVLKNADYMQELIRKYWQKTLEREDVIIEYEVKGFGSKTIRPFVFNEENIQERVKRTDIEGVEELDMIVFKDSRPKTFSRILALNVYGHTIEWKSPHRINSSHRVLAFAEAPELRDSEKPSHRGFKSTSTFRDTSNRIKDAIRSKMDEYRDLTKTSQSEDNEIQKEIEEINELIRKTDDVNKFFKDDEEGPGPGPSQDKDNCYPANITTRPENIGRGDKFEVGFDIKNPKGQGYDAKAEVEFLYPRSKIDEVEDQVIATAEMDEEVMVKAGKTKSVGTYQFEIPDTEIEGRYRIRVKVKTLYPKNTGTESTTGWIQVGEDQENPGGTPKRGLIKSYNFTNGEPNWKREFSDSALYINVAHPRFLNEVKRSNDGDALRDYVSQAAFEALKEVIIEQRVEESDSVKEVSDKIEETNRRMDELESEHLNEA